MTQVRDVMTNNTLWLSPTATMQEAAQLMADNNLGFLPVAENDRMIGMMTDRDMVTRGMAQNLEAQSTQIRDVMTPKTYYCYDDQTSTEICQNMAELQIRRMPVVNRDKRLVGVVSFGDLAQSTEAQLIGQAEQQITAPLEQAKAA